MIQTHLDDIVAGLRVRSAWHCDRLLILAAGSQSLELTVAQGWQLLNADASDRPLLNIFLFLRVLNPIVPNNEDHKGHEHDFGGVKAGLTTLEEDLILDEA
mgnify:CR=1 FL=1|jgi:hypothetical protein